MAENAGVGHSEQFWRHVNVRAVVNVFCIAYAASGAKIAKFVGGELGAGVGDDVNVVGFDVEVNET
jgi:hypothetical protein